MNDFKSAEIDSIPDSSTLLTTDSKEWLSEQVFWDSTYNRPFRIEAKDIGISQNLNVPLPHCYYIHRIQDNFRWMPIHKAMRKTKCTISEEIINTNWPKEYDNRIVSEEEYLKIIK